LLLQNAFEIAIKSRRVRVLFNCLSSHRAIDTHATASVFPTDIHGHSLLGHFLVVLAGCCMAIAVTLLAVKALTSCAGLPRDLIVHGTAFFTSFATRVALAFAFLMLKDKRNAFIRYHETSLFLSYAYLLRYTANSCDCRYIADILQKMSVTLCNISA